MLKQLGTDTREATDNLKTLVEVRGDETISESEAALIQRLAHRHSDHQALRADQGRRRGGPRRDAGR